MQDQIKCYNKERKAEELERERDLDGAVEDASQSDGILEDPVDLDDGAVRLFGGAVRHVVHVEDHLLHLPPPPPSSSSFLFAHFI